MRASPILDVYRYRFAPLSASTDQLTYQRGAANAAQRVLTAKIDESALSVMDFLGVYPNEARDSWAGIQAAMNAAVGRSLLFPPGTYTISAPVVGVSSVTVWGLGATITATTRIAQLFNFTGQSNWHIRGLAFDLGKTVLPTYVIGDYPTRYNTGVYAYQCSNFSIQDCTFSNLYTNGIFLYQCSGKCDLLRNVHTSPAQSQKILLEHIIVQTCSFRLLVDDCDFINTAPASADFGVCAFFASGTTARLTYTNNHHEYCGRNSVGGHQLASFSCYLDSVNVTVKDNTFLNNLQQVIRLSSVIDADVDNNYMTMASVAGTSDQMVSIEGSYSAFPGVVGCRNIHVHRNTFIDEYATDRRGVFMAAYDYAIPLIGIRVDHNEFRHMAYAVLMGGPYEGVWIEDNLIRGNNGGIIARTVTAGGVTVTAAHGVTQAQSFCNDLAINRNTCALINTASNPINLDYVTYTGTIGEVEINGNRIRMTGASAGAACVVYRGVAGQGRVTVRDNRPDNYTFAFDLANGAYLTLSDNRTRNVVAANFEVNTSTFTAVERSGNNWSGSRLSGRSGLTAGTVTVLSTEVVASDNITLSRDVAGGSLGHLSVGTIVPGTSFVINSSDAGDTSTIFWKIEH